MIDDAENWAPRDWNVEYCLSETVPGNCGFIINLGIVLVVIICNVGKVVAMSVVAFSPRLGCPLITIGDVVSSFLDDPDKTTKNMCLTSKHDIVTNRAHWPPERPKIWQSTPLRWYHAASKTRWWTCILL